MLEACALDPTPAGRRDAALAELVHGHGLRPDVVADLNLDDFDFIAETLRIDDRTIRLRRHAVIALLMWLVARGVVLGRYADALFVTVWRDGRISGKARVGGPAIAWKLAHRREAAAVELPEPTRAVVALARAG